MDFLAMLLLGGVGLWIWWKSHGADATAIKRESRAYDAKIAERRAVTERMPDSASAWEQLGDAFREADQYGQAVIAYERASMIQSASPGMSSGGVGLDHKIRLSRMEAAQGGAIGKGEAARMGQQICRRCGTLSLPGARTCAACEETLPVDTMREVWEASDIRTRILRDALELTAMLLVVTIAIAVFQSMPLEIKGVLLISTFAVFGWKLLRLIGGK